jgi:hypothetical protein
MDARIEKAIREVMFGEEPIYEDMIQVAGDAVRVIAFLKKEAEENLSPGTVYELVCMLPNLCIPSIKYIVLFVFNSRSNLPLENNEQIKPNYCKYELEKGWYFIGRYKTGSA